MPTIDLTQFPDLHTTPETIPEAPDYLWGYDLSMSGWGPFQGDSDGRWSIKDLMEDDPSLRLWQIPKDQLCPVLYPVFPDTDVELLRFNLRMGDVAVVYRDLIERGHPGSEPDPEWLAKETEKFKARHTAFAHSIVYGFLASNYFSGLLEPYNETGLWWLMNKRLHGIPVVARSHGTRWYKEPGLGWTFYDDEHVAFRYADPREQPKKGDFALVAEQGRRLVKQQTYAYTGRKRRYKVIPVEEAHLVA